VPGESLLSNEELTISEVNSKQKQVPQKETVPKRIVVKDKITKPLAKEIPLKKPITNSQQRVEVSDQKGKITVSIPNSWADIWIDNSKVGRTGMIEPIKITPGKHTLRLENKYSLPYTEVFSISAGETRHFEINSLKRKPSYVVFDPNLNKECKVLIDKRSSGTLTTIRYKLKITEPNIPHEIKLKCPTDEPEQFRSLVTEIPKISPGSTVPIKF
jgi:hypothetical protein